MPLLGFQKQFAGKVESGEKRQTIRAYRKDGRDPKVGDRLYLYTGLRTKQSRKLGEAICTAVRPIRIRHRRREELPRMWGRVEIQGARGAWRRLTWGETASLAFLDGFMTGTGGFFYFFQANHGLPFKGLLIRWDKIDRGEG